MEMKGDKQVSNIAKGNESVTDASEHAGGEASTAGASSATSAASNDVEGFAHQATYKARKKTDLPLYNLVSRLPGPRNFVVKIFMFSFIVTQLPMFALLLYVVMNVELNAEILTTVSIVLIAALLGSVSTVISLIAYAEPVTAISKAIQNVSSDDYEPDLPDGYNDEIGELMANTQGALKKLHSMLHNMHELSIRDELTGVYNRRFLMEQAGQLMSRAARYEEPVTLIFIDIDNFKKINDQFSHQVGDHALRQLANIMTDTARGSDLIARLGGDEFVLLFPNTSMMKAMQLSERLRSSISKHDWSALLPGVHLTLSMGMAEAVERESFENLLDRADANLHKAKKEGRNQIRA